MTGPHQSEHDKTMKLLFNDLETFSDVPINHGVHKYAERAEVMLWTYAFDNGPVQCWDVTANLATPTDLLVALNSPDIMTVWHNGGMFDSIVLRHALPVLCPPIERIHDTMAQALAHGLPGALGALGDILGSEQDRTNSGIKLDARDAFQLHAHFVQGARRPVRANRRHRINGVGDRDDPSAQRYFVSGKRVRIPLAAPGFMMSPHRGHHVLEMRHLRDKHGALGRVSLHHLELAIRQLARQSKDWRELLVDLANIVQ